MRVEDRNLTGSSISEASKSAQSEALGRGNASRASGYGSGSDQVELSDLASLLAQTLSAGSAQRSSRVEELATDYRQGLYTIDSAQTSQALVSEAIGASQ